MCGVILSFEWPNFWAADPAMHFFFGKSKYGKLAHPVIELKGMIRMFKDIIIIYLDEND